ncbi:hypothetical protein CAP31_11480 [Sulfuriferula sp. AH1]|uniref:BatD family protein n=1 Tax=Sulfuriferula sp. AH1 TaxID=1985873 RepID=UPI000B3BA896|nr:BatD family protein [Sulfuriferula sp. AH1]ARU32239.1 hypothetical protein CAP31_11480 [Sulfuriferula sp. AH1]
MVRHLLIALWLAMLTVPAWAQPHFSLTADKHDIALGEALTVTIRAQDASAELDSLDLNAFKSDFDIYTRSTSKQTEVIRGKPGTTETTTLILYPLHSGQLQLPALKFAGNSSGPVAVTVHESGQDTPQVLLKPALTPAHPLTRQAATLTLDIYDDGSLQWSPPKLTAPAGTYIRELAPTQRDTTLNGTPFTVHRLAWAIMPLTPGSVTINFPMLNAIKFGNRLRYAAPSLQFDTRPAPRYLPVYVPIGKLTATSQPLSGKLILNRPINWSLIVRGAGISAEGIAKLLPELTDSDTLHFYPPQIRLADENDKSLEQTLLVTLPFQPLRTGTIQLPKIELPYYNPATGVIESVAVASPALTVINPLWHAAAKLVAIMAGLGFVIWLSRISVRLYRRKRTRRASLQRVAAAADAHQLSQALLNFDWGSGQYKRTRCGYG